MKSAADETFEKQMLFISEVPFCGGVSRPPIDTFNAVRLRRQENVSIQNSAWRIDRKPLVVNRKPIVQQRPALQAKMSSHPLVTTSQHTK